MLFLFRLLPVFLLRLIAFPVGFCYFLLLKKTRIESRNFLEKLDELSPKSALCHIISFALALVEKTEAWGGKVSFNRIGFQQDDHGELMEGLERGQGAFLLSSHLGNMELIRALADYNRTGVSREVPVTAIMDTAMTAQANYMLRKLNPRFETRMIDAGGMGPETVMLLHDRLAAGELAVIAADRTARSAGSRTLSLPFLGRDAPFPYGPFLLASLMEVSVYAVFALRHTDITLFPRYDMRVHKSPLTFGGSRRERESGIRELARWFAGLLERYCKKHPYQWYNFYDFWQEKQWNHS
jgi:predicted LPLAT superfamily acyltransferase